MKSRQLILVLLTWGMALLLACLLDAPSARWIRDSGAEGWMRSHRLFHSILKTPGEYWFIALVAALVLAQRWPRWHDAVFVLLAPAVSGINGLLKWMLGRYRPYTWGAQRIDELKPFSFDLFADGASGLLYARNLSFPSGHACLAFAAATALSILYPRHRWVFFGIALITAAERAVENAHWLSDCVAAAALGVGGVKLVQWIVNCLLPSPRDVRPGHQETVTNE